MKNKRSMIIIIAMVLLLAVVLGMGGATFAKYVTSAETGAQSATVAKWGYVVTVNANNLFGKEYKAGAIQTVGTAGVDVKGATNRVAPGTSGSMTIDVTGTAEVMAAITVDMKEASADPLVKYSDVVLTKDAGGNTITDGYYPIKWTVTDNTKTDDPGTPTDERIVLDGGNLAALKSTLESYSETAIAPGETTTIDLDISWVWDFSTSTVNDAYDTALGDMMVTPYEGAATGTTEIAFELVVTVQQIQNP